MILILSPPIPDTHLQAAAAAACRANLKAVRAEAGAASREAGLTELAPAGLKRRPGVGPLMDST